jgi:hypothetical protein
MMVLINVDDDDDADDDDDDDLFAVWMVSV